ncbi:MAG: hypothetical protein WBD40_17235 [Tepidisphaeraceae bacterium]
MKWIATMLLMLVCGAGTMIGCEAREEAAPVAPGTVAPRAQDDPTPPGSEATEPAAPTTAPATQASAALAIVNQYCAVDTDHKIDPKVTTVHEGKTIGFCCEDCIPAFKKEPAKYLASLK